MAIPFYEEFYQLTGDVKGALFLQQLIYWQDKADDKELGCYKTVEELRAETKLTYKKQLKIRKLLVDLGVLKTTHKRLIARLYFKIDVKRLEALLGKSLSEVYGVVKRSSNGIKSALVKSFTNTKPKDSSDNISKHENENHAENRFFMNIFEDVSFPQKTDRLTNEVVSYFDGFYQRVEI